MDQLYIRSRGEVTGPFSMDELRGKIMRGELVPLHELSYDGKSWMRAGRIWDELVPRPKDAVPPELARKRTPPRKDPAWPQSLPPESAPQPTQTTSPPGNSINEEPLKVERVAPEASKPEATKPDAPKLPPRPAAESFTEPDENEESPPSPAGRLGSRGSLGDRDGPAENVPSEPAVGFHILRGLSLLLGIAAMAPLIAGAFEFAGFLRIFVRLQPPDENTLAAVRESGDLEAVAGLDDDFVGASIVAKTLLLVWIYFTVAYLYRLSHRRMKFTPGWSVAWFLIPIANLWKPYQVVNEIRLRQEKFHNRFVKASRHSSLMQLWWATNVAALLVGRFLAFTAWTRLRSAPQSEWLNEWNWQGLADLPIATKVYAAAGIGWLFLETIAAFLTLRVIIQIGSLRPVWSEKARRRLRH